METRNQFSDKIASYLDQLIGSMGLRADIPGSGLAEMMRLFQIKKYDQCAEEIKNWLNLPVILQIKYEGEEDLFKDPFGIFDDEIVQDINMAIQYSQMKKPARIEIPENLPPYMSTNLKTTRLNVSIHRLMIVSGFFTFAYVVAHELAHIVLHVIRHKLCNDETAIDLTVMVLGFIEIMKIGRTTWLCDYGYLDDQTFDFAYREIRRRQAELKEEETGGQTFNL